MKKMIIGGITTLALLTGIVSNIGGTGNLIEATHAQLRSDLQTTNVATPLNAEITANSNSQNLQSTRSQSDQSFRDIVGHWAEKSINGALTRGYVDGYPNGTFLPNNNVSRAEFVKMLVSALELEVSNTSSPWYTSYVNVAEAEGIYQSGDFKDSNWTKAISREEMSKVAVRAIGVSDVEKTQWMYMATKNGLISGTSPGVIAPEGSTTRAQAITVIERVLSVKQGTKLPIDKYAVSAAELLWHDTNIMTMLPRYFSDSFNGKPFDNKAMVSTSPNGKAVCRITKLVAIDLGDPKDPNRKIIEDTEYAWADNSRYYKLLDSDGYAVMGISETKISGKMNVKELFPCRMTFQNDDWYEIQKNATSPKQPNRSYGIMPWNPKYEQFHSSLDISEISNGTFTFATGTLFPKTNFISDKPFRYMFGGMGNWQGTFTTLYQGKLNPEYQQ